MAEYLIAFNGDTRLTARPGAGEGHEQAEDQAAPGVRDVEGGQRMAVGLDDHLHRVDEPVAEAPLRRGGRTRD